LVSLAAVRSSLRMRLCERTASRRCCAADQTSRPPDFSRWGALPINTRSSGCVLSYVKSSHPTADIARTGGGRCALGAKSRTTQAFPFSQVRRRFAPVHVRSTSRGRFEPLFPGPIEQAFARHQLPREWRAIPPPGSPIFDQRAAARRARGQATENNERLLHAVCACRRRDRRRTRSATGWIRSFSRRASARSLAATAPEQSGLEIGNHATRFPNSKPVAAEHERTQQPGTVG